MLTQHRAAGNGASSHYGWWVTQPNSAPPVQVNCSDSAEGGLITTWPLPDGLEGEDGGLSL